MTLVKVSQRVFKGRAPVWHAVLSKSNDFRFWPKNRHARLHCWSYADYGKNNTSRLAIINQLTQADVT